VTGVGKDFSAGLDYSDLDQLIAKVSNPPDREADVLLQGGDVGRRAKFLNGLISSFQETFSSIESCAKPVIAAIKGNCIGAAFSLLGSCDVRYASADTLFQMKEVDIGLTADMGSLQRIPKAIGNNSLFREYMFSGKKFSAQDAERMGLISTTFGDAETTKSAAIELANLIAQKSPIAVQGAKVCARYSRDHSVYDGLRFMANWNMTMYQSEDLIKGASAVASKSKTPPQYNDL
jgi:delta(3,5)-delta(2,4)-dienoyl-CoA isomerase